MYDAGEGYSSAQKYVQFAIYAIFLYNSIVLYEVNVILYSSRTHSYLA
jgi:hypothetical protein